MELQLLHKSGVFLNEILAIRIGISCPYYSSPTKKKCFLKYSVDMKHSENILEDKQIILEVLSDSIISKHSKICNH